VHRIEAIMSVRSVLDMVIIGLGILLRPAVAEACGCAGTMNSAAAFRRAHVVFAGTVASVQGPRLSSQVNADGSVTGGVVPGPRAATFVVDDKSSGDK
jgi:hypothetical protein